MQLNFYKYGFFILYIFYTLIFVLIGPLVLTFDYSILNLFFISIFFAIIINFLWRTSLQGIHFSINSTHNIYSNILFFLGVLIPIVYFMLYGIPILSSDPEKERLLIGARLGLVNRVWISAIFIWGILQSISLNRYRYFKIGIVLVILVMTGFRGRPIDFVLVIALASIISGRINLKKTTIIKIIGISMFCFYGLYIVTSIRFGENALELLVRRIFLINYEINITRVFEYIEFKSALSPFQLFLDSGSLISENNSMQQIVSFYHNNQDERIVMTLTHLGEIFLTSKFGIFISLLFSILYCGITFLFIRFFLKLIKQNNIRFAILIYILYFYPRVIVTGGVSNAFLTKILPALLIASIIIIIQTLFQKKRI